MNKLWVLYLKEMKDSALVFSILAALVIGIEVYSLFFVGDFGAIFLSITPIMILITVLPLIMFYLYAHEWKSGSRYLLMALPVPRYYIGLSKYLAVFSVGCVLFAIGFVSVYWNYQRFSFPQSWSQIGVQFTQGMQNIQSGSLWIAGIIAFLALLYFALGMVVTIQSINLVVKKFPIVVTIVSFLIICLLYIRLGEWLVWMVFQAYESTLIQLPLEFSFALHKAMFSGNFVIPTSAIYFFLGWMAYTVLMGIIFLMGGLFITEKYLEV